jgi:hypothetical protein
LVTRLAGDTHYEMNARSENPAEPGEIVDIRSRLEFPLDLTLLGLEVEWQPGVAEPSGWSLTGGVHTNVSDPSSRMTDEDWVGSRQLAHTESDGDLRLVLVTAGTEYRLRESDRSSVSLLLDMEYERIEQHLVGFEGWQGSLFSDTQYPVSGTAPVVNYAVNYASAQAGADFTYMFRSYYQVSARATAGPAYAWDYDDHLLRGRLAEGSGWGVAVNSRLGIEMLPGFLNADWLTASLMGGVSFRHVEGEADQRWYREGEDMPEGTVIEGLPHELESLQYGVTLSIGACF